MLTIIAGEDTAASRTKLQAFKKSYQEKGYLIRDMNLNEVPDLLKTGALAVNLFGQEPICIIEHLSRKYNGRQKTAFKEAVQELAKRTDIHLVDWEEGKSAYELSGLKRIATTFDECKPQKNVFELLDACYPKNLTPFLNTLRIVSQTQDPGFIYALLCKHVRKLILAKEHALDTKTPPWQKQKLTQQAEQWETEQLLKFYEGLTRIDTAIKTGASVYNVNEAIELLSCYYLP